MLDTDLPVPERIAGGIDRATVHIAAARETLTGAQRVVIAGAERSAWNGEGSESPVPVPTAIVYSGRRS
ncbi:MAG: hypothetical protein ACI8TP_001734 [Acidimicrobiales bacterium]|jgi:hypothetical protein